ncbi:hypothetical protein [Streptomyces alfalfae]|uniref:hypothetical protein n=1 Tax=Streptomyces alfalfae TaxID=1642299 RepID=UPI001E2CAF49|nr:hypothetical protein [Streptomyces alfalfae]
MASPYAAKRYCDAVAPLQHLRTVPATYGKDRLGALAAWPDDRLATSLYECGVAGLGRTAGADALGTLLRTFPDSRQAGEVGPALRAAVTSREAALKGSAPCTAVDELRAIGATADALPAGKVDGEAVRGSADRAVRRGVYACGVDEFEDGRSTEAAETLNGFAEAYPADKRHDRAEDITVAAEIAAERPSAGRRLPPSRPGGSGEVELVLANLGPRRARGALHRPHHRRRRAQGVRVLPDLPDQVRGRQGVPRGHIEVPEDHFAATRGRLPLPLQAGHRTQSSRRRDAQHGLPLHRLLLRDPWDRWARTYLTPGQGPRRSVIARGPTA